MISFELKNPHVKVKVDLHGDCDSERIQRETKIAEHRLDMLSPGKILITHYHEEEDEDSGPLHYSRWRGRAKSKVD